jgi:23S rRNA U2552 (ribose-2'-O)-methylase RlmE/FtsJ
MSMLTWALEVEITHADRLVRIIGALGQGYDQFIRVQDNLMHKSKGISVLLFVHDNVLLHPNFPYECLKYISRVFYVPYACREPEWIFSHHAVQNLIRPEDNNKDEIIIKLICSPKELEPLLGEYLYDAARCARSSNTSLKYLDLHPTKHAHVMMVLYDAANAIFRWGVMDRDSVQRQLMTSEAIESELSCRRKLDFSKLTVEPVCRAYYKLDEILNLWLPKWNWTLPQGREGEQGILAMDIGASPGGWTQRLASHCSAVLSIDPGELRPEILRLDNVFHLQHLVQAEAVTSILQTVQTEATGNVEVIVGTGAAKTLCVNEKQKVRFIVCDVNCDARTTAGFLTKHVLPFIEGFGCCCCSRGDRKHFGSGNIISTSVILVVTLKLMKGPKKEHIVKARRDLVSMIDREFPTVACCNSSPCKWQWDWHNDCDSQLVHLCANSTNERTVVLRRRCYCCQ